MSDHWHYASDIHGAAEEHHRHYDDERAVQTLRSDLEEAASYIRGLREDLGQLTERVAELEGDIRKLRSQADRP